MSDLDAITALSPFKRCDRCKGAGTVTKWRIGGTTTHLRPVRRRRDRAQGPVQPREKATVMKRIVTIAAFALIEEAAVIWALHTGRDLIWKAQVAALIRQAQGKLDDRKRIS